MENELKVPENCVNCGAGYTGNFCHNCGQRRNVKRLTIKSVWMDFQQHTLGLDTKFLRTVRFLTINPGMVARSNIEGNRVRFLGPVSYFLIVATLIVLTISFFDVSWVEFMNESITTFQVAEQTEAQEKLQQDLMQQIFANFRTFQFLVIPFIGLAAMILFRKSGYNLLEHMVMAFYVQGHLLFITLANLVIYLTAEMTFFRWSSIISLVFYGFACVNFYPGKSRIKRFFKGLLVQVLGVLFFIIAFAIVGLIAGFVLALTNPEFLKGMQPPEGL